MAQNSLGQKTTYVSNYDPSVLYAIRRSESRKKNGVDESGFYGYDRWNCYEFSFLNNNGKPIQKVLRFAYGSDSPNIVESKSLKLYLYGFSATRFFDEKDVILTIKTDLENIILSPIEYVDLYDHNYSYSIEKISNKNLLDNLEVEVNGYKPDRSLLKTEKIDSFKKIERFSFLFKTNCPVTGQPDWATVHIKYISNNVIEDSSLLKYIISFRNHADYHESCCEKIYSDVYATSSPKYLLVECFFTRRGGIDINPTRVNQPVENPELEKRYWRQ
ncbi:MAG TPA: NADPH-dependent 7-cyano-7-deazaguanine reductase QueF [Spirochaetota bacterium]|nr:NADPH-dependent 7-cyano-7-deazaguanine reductase QueF [Spirochaetota bacterium]